MVFEQEGLYDYVSLGELENDLIQLDDDLLSMEYPKFFSNYFLVSSIKIKSIQCDSPRFLIFSRRILILIFFFKNGDQTWFMSIAKSLINIQDWFGKIPNIHLHGNCSKVTQSSIKCNAKLFTF